MQRKPPEPALLPPPEAKVYAAWRCPDCGAQRAGHIAPTDFTARRCLGIPRNKRTDGGRICGALMIEVFRDREAAA